MQARTMASGRRGGKRRELQNEEEWPKVPVKFHFKIDGRHEDKMQSDGQKWKCDVASREGWNPFHGLIYFFSTIILVSWPPLPSQFCEVTMMTAHSTLNLKTRIIFDIHNIIQIHNNIKWDWQYYTEYSPYSNWMWRIFYIIMSVPQNTVM